MLKPYQKNGHDIRNFYVIILHIQKIPKYKNQYIVHIVMRICSLFLSEYHHRHHHTISRFLFIHIYPYINHLNYNNANFNTLSSYLSVYILLLYTLQSFSVQMENFISTWYNGIWIENVTFDIVIAIKEKYFCLSTQRYINDLKIIIKYHIPSLSLEQK